MLTGLQHDICEVVLRCMAKSPTDRYQSGSELAGVLERLAERACNRCDETLASVPTEAITRSGASPASTGAVTISLGKPTVSSALLPGVRRKSYELEFQNAASSQVELRLAASADEIDFELPERVPIASNESATVAVRLSPRRRRWRGDTRLLPFNVTAGEFKDRPERWAPYAGGALFSVAGVVFALMISLGGGDGGEGAEGPPPPVRPTQQAGATNAIRCRSSSVPSTRWTVSVTSMATRATWSRPSVLDHVAASCPPSVRSFASPTSRSTTVCCEVPRALSRSPSSTLMMATTSGGWSTTDWNFLGLEFPGVGAARSLIDDL